MTVFTFHLANVRPITAFKAQLAQPDGRTVTGLKHAECMTQMTLGAPMLSPSRIQFRTLTMFAAWENELALDSFLKNSELGNLFTTGWHVRMKFLRRWGSFRRFEYLPESTGEQDPSEPVVAVTLARMKFLQIPRFISWGIPVERLIRDHPGKTFATALTRLPQTVSTFSIWESQKEMTEMVHGHSNVPQPKRHSNAMVERKRKNFHFEFITLRFKPIKEYGVWEGRKNLLPNVTAV